MALTLAKWTCERLNCICAPSPQSIMKHLPRISMSCAEALCLRVGKALPHPKI